MMTFCHQIASHFKLYTDQKTFHIRHTAGRCHGDVPPLGITKIFRESTKSRGKLTKEPEDRKCVFTKYRDCQQKGQVFGKIN